MGSVFVGGETGILTEASTAFVSKFDSEGNLQWRREFGEQRQDTAGGVAPDGLGNVYVSGTMHFHPDRPSVGDSDGFLAKFDSLGNLIWKYQFGTAGEESFGGVSADAFGNIYVAGRSNSDILPGLMVGTGPLFLSKFDPNGNLLWTSRFGNESDDGGGLTVDGMGGIYISGFSSGTTSLDPALFKLFDPGFLVPEPTAAANCTAMLLGFLIVTRRRPKNSPTATWQTSSALARNTETATTYRILKGTQPKPPQPAEDVVLTGLEPAVRHGGQGELPTSLLDRRGDPDFKTL
jgi:hypothetical protein